MSSAASPAPALAPAVTKPSSGNGTSWKTKALEYSLYGSLFVTLALVITNIIMLSNAAGSADSWNEIKKQISSITGVAFTCGIFLTIAIYLMVMQYPQMQVVILSIVMGLAITLSYVAVCIAVISR